MFKTAFSIALVGLVSAQNLGSLATQATQAVNAQNLGAVGSLATEAIAAVQPALNTNVGFSQTDNSAAWSLGNHEWSVTEHNGEYGFDTNTLSSGAESLAPTLSALLTNVGTVAQQNSEAIQNVIAAEAESMGVDVEDSIENVANGLGVQLQGNAETLADIAQNNYDQGVGVAAANTGAAVNAANDEAGTAAVVGDAVNSAVNAATPENAASLANTVAASSPVQAQAPSNAGSLATEAANAATNAAGTIDANQAAATASNLANQGAATAGKLVPGNAAKTAQNSANAAANSLNANGVNSANDVVSRANGSQ